MKQLIYDVKTDISMLSNIVQDRCSMPLPDSEINILMEGTCNIDHEGYDLNSIEQAYYQTNNILLTYDSTWYKDGGMTAGTNAIIYPWIASTKNHSDLYIDHSYLVFRYPITGEARNQILKYSSMRSELLKLTSVEFKCGLDLCIDYIDTKSNSVETVVHIEWDFRDINELFHETEYVKEVLNQLDWNEMLPIIKRFNVLAKQNKMSAFDQADVRSMLIFGSKSYNLIPTL